LEHAEAVAFAFDAPPQEAIREAVQALLLPVAEPAVKLVERR